MQEGSTKAMSTFSLTHEARMMLTRLAADQHRTRTNCIEKLIIDAYVARFEVPEPFNTTQHKAIESPKKGATK